MVKQLNKAIAYMDSNLCGEIRWDEAARIACVTEDAFSRFFSYMAGMTLREYVRRRRLTLAAYDLRDGVKVIDAAVKYGWDSADAFTKAFKRQHGITPTQAKDPANAIKVYPPASFHIIVKGAEEMEVKFMEVSGMEIFGVSRGMDGAVHSRFEFEHIMWSDDCGSIPQKICAGYDGVWYGIWDGARYTIARERKDVQGSGLESLHIPGGTYAVFTTRRGGFAGDELPKLHDLIHHSWLPDSGYRLARNFEVEVYHLWTGRSGRREKRYYEIWIPVEKSDKLE